MTDFRTEIRAAFAREQAAAPPPAALRAQVAAVVEGHARAVAKPRARIERNVHWSMVVAAALLALAVVAGFMAVRYATRQPVLVKPGPAPQLCVPVPTTKDDRFAGVHGRITYSDRCGIWALDANDPTIRSLVSELVPTFGPPELTPIAWSRDGRRLLLLTGWPGWRTGHLVAAEMNLHVMESDGTRMELTHDGRSGVGSFSPDGSMVVYEHRDLAFPQRLAGMPEVVGSDLYVVAVAGGTPRLMAHSQKGWWLGSPTWSPDGSRIAYTVFKGGRAPSPYEIWIMNSDGSGQRQLVGFGTGCGGGVCIGGMAWSPDGSILAFSSVTGSAINEEQIYLVRADGSALRQITQEGGSWPVWSPDGSRIAFIRNLRIDSSNYGPEGRLYTMAADGQDVRVVWEAGPIDLFAWNPVA
jgi:Tol biopolymer transport system component